MFPLALVTNNGVSDGTNPFEQILPCGCDEGTNTMNINLEEGETEWTSVITKAKVSYDENTKSWIVGEVTILDNVNQKFETIPEPDQSFIMSVINSIIGSICGLFPSFGFCSA